MTAQYNRLIMLSCSLSTQCVPCVPLKLTIKIPVVPIIMHARTDHFHIAASVQSAEGKSMDALSLTMMVHGII